jgi:uncharacterized membrane protein
MHQPMGAAFDIVLLLHAGSAVVGLVTMTAAAATGGRLRRTLEGGRAVPDALRRYFRPGFNWAGRAVYGIPVFGFALLSMSDGAYALGDGWVLVGLALFAGVVLLGEGAVWPAERRLQAALATVEGSTGLADEDGSLERDARVMSTAAGITLVLLVVGTAVMVAQP